MGKPIAEHQLIAAKLADMETKTEAARGLLYRFGQMADAGVPEAELTKASAMAKLLCGDVAMEVSTEAVQILGGYGYVKEYPVERFMRDAKITQIYEGTQEVQRLVIAREMVKESRAFLLAGVALPRGNLRVGRAGSSRLRAALRAGSGPAPRRCMPRAPRPSRGRDLEHVLRVPLARAREVVRADERDVVGDDDLRVHEVLDAVGRPAASTASRRTGAGRRSSAAAGSSMR